jgi:hypothetical protein
VYSKLHQADHDQDSGQKPKKQLTSKRQVQAAEKQPCGQYYAAAQIDGHRASEPQTNELVFAAKGFPQQGEPDAEENSA